MANLHLKNQIVVVNEFSIPSKGGSKGSRGATPGAYVTRYMARKGATETLTPIAKNRTDDFILHYMARDDAVEKDVDTKARLKRDMSKKQRYGGVAFSRSNISLSDEELEDESRFIQETFEKGHTVMKMVLSFDHDYLKKHGLVPQNLEIEKRGDYRGFLDQMKLRTAITAGMNRMGARFYDDLHFIGTIQVDTEHVHCHIAALDAGRGKRARDGSQKGKLTKRAISTLRRSIDATLDKSKSIQFLSSSVAIERRNVTTYVKRWAYKQMHERALGQFLIATLPEDKSLWRAGTNAKVMQKPNGVLRSLIEEVLEQDDSPLSDAIYNITKYAGERKRKEKLSNAEYLRLIDDGKERMIQSAMNGVYGVLKALPEDRFNVRTPMLDVMSLDMEDLLSRIKEKDESKDILQFAYRARKFSARLKHHSEQAERMRNMKNNWQERFDRGEAVLDSKPLMDWYTEEEEYHTKLVAKYRRFLPRFGELDDFSDQLEDIKQAVDEIDAYDALSKDYAIKRLDDLDEADMRGLAVYGVTGARYLAEGSDDGLKRFNALRERAESKLSTLVSNLRSELVDWGKSLEERDGEYVISDARVYNFDEVKGLDLHHLHYDFTTGVEVGKHTFTTFIDQYKRRSEIAKRTRAYLIKTNQEEFIESLGLNDVELMKKTMDETFNNDGYLVSYLARELIENENNKKSATVRLDFDIADVIEQSLSTTNNVFIVDETQAELERESAERSELQ